MVFCSSLESHFGWRPSLHSGPILFLAAVLLHSPANVNCGAGPQITEAIGNTTVALGREASLKCVVTHLLDYKVAWVHIDRQMILTIGRHVITRIPRFNIIHDSHHTWTLTIRDVQAEDKGYYMCQVNTDPMISQTGHLDVVVPPTIIDDESSPSSVSVREKHNASLICKSAGVPYPNITWRREDGRPIFRDTQKTSLTKLERSVSYGDYLELQDISREQMGAYLCIASNRIPPSVSKRITLTVEFQPMMYIPNQLIGAPVNTQVTLECTTEASPKAITYWVFQDVMILMSQRHHTHEEVEGYRLHSKLTIKSVIEGDYGAYRCVSKNSLGETEGQIRLYEIVSESTSVATTFTPRQTRSRVRHTTKETFPYNPGLPNTKHQTRQPYDPYHTRPTVPEKQEQWGWRSSGTQFHPVLIILLLCLLSSH